VNAAAGPAVAASEMATTKSLPNISSSRFSALVRIDLAAAFPLALPVAQCRQRMSVMLKNVIFIETAQAAL
jgi:hypothetical protein